jgi:hypothetical protein
MDELVLNQLITLTNRINEIDNKMTKLIELTLLQRDAGKQKPTLNVSDITTLKFITTAIITEPLGDIKVRCDPRSNSTRRCLRSEDKRRRCYYNSKQS